MNIKWYLGEMEVISLDQRVVREWVGVSPLTVELLARQLSDSIGTEGGTVVLALLTLVLGFGHDCF